MKRILVAVFIFNLFLSSAPLAVSSEKNNNSDAQKSLPYKVSVGDKLGITVYEENDLSDTFEIKEDGTITYPLLGHIAVEGLNKMQIEQKISLLLKEDYLVNPHVRVKINSYNKRCVLLMGHVEKSGTYEFPEGKNLTLLELITQAGGFTGYAAMNGTKIIRTTESGEKVVLDPRFKDIMSGRKKDIRLEPGDLVIVPERLF